MFLQEEEGKGRGVSQSELFNLQESFDNNCPPPNKDAAPSTWLPGPGSAHEPVWIFPLLTALRHPTAPRAKVYILNVNASDDTIWNGSRGSKSVY